MTVNELLQALVDELAAGGVPAPLGQSFTLANVWHDLAQLAGEAPPAAVVALVDDEPIAAVDFFDRPAWVAEQVARRQVPRA